MSKLFDKKDVFSWSNCEVDKVKYPNVKQKFKFERVQNDA